MRAYGEPLEETARLACSECEQAGRAIGEITLRALLTPQALARFQPGTHAFCKTGECPIVYFGANGSFRREDVLVPVFQKEPEGTRIVCYCLAIREDEIHREIHADGCSVSAERIRALVKAGRCACDVRNPQGACCLGQVAAIGSRAAESR